MPVDRPIVCPVLVGRDQYLEVAERSLERALGGQGTVMLVAGEAGVGKTRIAGEVKRQAAERGFRAIEGHAFETDRAAPYAPLTDLLRTMAPVRSERAARDLGPSASELAVLLPELVEWFPDASPPTELNPEQEKRRLFHAVVQLFVRLAAEQPLLIIVEDVHWADDLSLELVFHVARRISAEPIVALVTYRSDEVNPALTHLLANLDRERLAIELMLPPLTLAGADAMLRAIFGSGRPARAELTHALYRLTDGNPFFIEEVLSSLVTSGDIAVADGAWERKPIAELRIPRSVQDAVMRRAARLSGGARELLRLAAVAGQRFEIDLLREMTGLDETDLIERVKELVSAQLVVEESAGRFRFRHALTREAVTAELLAIEQQSLHRRIAEAIAARPDGGTERVADLAYHFHEAAEWRGAFEYARRAGESALGMHANAAAVEQFTRALGAAERLGMRPPAELHGARAIAQDRLGDFEAARADHEAALAEARALGERRAEWQALLDLALLWSGRDYGRAGSHCDEALALARALGDEALLAASLNRLGNCHTMAARPIEARRCHEEALTVFERLGDRRGQAETLDLLGMAAANGCDLALGAGCFGRAAELFAELGDRPGQVTPLVMLTVMRGHAFSDLLIAEPASADGAADAERGLSIAREVGWRAAESFALFESAGCLATRGAYGLALERARGALAIAEEIEHRQWTLAARFTLGFIYLDVLAPHRASREIELAAPMAGALGAPFWIASTEALLAAALFAQGAPVRAQEVIDGVLTRHADSLGARFAARVGAEIALSRGRPAAALATADELLGTARPTPGSVAAPRLELLRGQALAALGRGEESEAVLLGARGTASSHGLRPMLWRVELALARLYRSTGREAEAARAFGTVRAIIDTLAGELLEEGLREELRRGAATLLPGGTRRAERQPGTLTGREREIATLIARGDSNLEIADALVVSKRTVESHVGSIMAKLGVGSRTQIAAWVVAQGLAAHT